MRSATRLTAAGAAAALAACGDATGPRSDGTVRVTARARTVAVRNVSDAAVFAVVIGRESSALADWYACADAARCPALVIAPNAQRSEERPTYQGRPEREANVYWWRAVSGPDGAPRPDSVRVLAVRFP